MLNSEEPDQGVNEMFHPFAKGRIPHRGEPMSCKMQWVSRRLLAPSKEVCPEEPKWCRIRCCSKLTCDMCMDFFSMIFCISSVVFYLGTDIVSVASWPVLASLYGTSEISQRYHSVSRSCDYISEFLILKWTRVPQPQRHFNAHLAAATSHDRGKRIGWSDLAKVGKGRYLLLIRHAACCSQVWARRWWWLEMKRSPNKGCPVGCYACGQLRYLQSRKPKEAVQRIWRLRREWTLASPFRWWIYIDVRST